MGPGTVCSFSRQSLSRRAARATLILSSLVPLPACVVGYPDVSRLPRIFSRVMVCPRPSMAGAQRTKARGLLTLAIIDTLYVLYASMCGSSTRVCIHGGLPCLDNN
ncbi:hypothetical protein F4778DRAFT_119935 [Xylariomycetidae sp. FL2044]|nr:hypothetical protein F4778DRAFT_119935 [Xylariomycetidae sp. FL2044]